MQVILLEEVQNLGNLGEEVRVKPGYARNYLLPYGKAVIANEQNRAALEARRTDLEKMHTEVLAKAQERARLMEGATVQISRKVGEEGQLFGSVTTLDIVDAMAQAGVELEKSEIHLSTGPIKEIGDHEIAVSLHPEVQVKITVLVVEEQ
ncbi:MAG: 50S ribosomal protein L9 [Acidiferrobacterales bacterium]|nr:50S ribosomal protein L9 [Gammaproteobacteria bacterium]